jgi:hypothetical protein
MRNSPSLRRVPSTDPSTTETGGVDLDMGKMNDRTFYGSLEEAFVALIFFFSFLSITAEFPGFS